MPPERQTKNDGHTIYTTILLQVSTITREVDCSPFPAFLKFRSTVTQPTLALETTDHSCCAYCPDLQSLCSEVSVVSAFTQKSQDFPQPQSLQTLQDGCGKAIPGLLGQYWLAYLAQEEDAAQSEAEGEAHRQLYSSMFDLGGQP